MAVVRLLSRYITAALITQLSLTSAGQCPPKITGSVEVFKCKCYEFQKRNTFWGNDKCQLKGGHLAKVYSEEIDDFLVEKSKIHLPNDKGVWIGASRESPEYPFYWTDGSPVKYTDWAPREPNDLLIAQNCVYLKKGESWRWASLQCNLLGFGFTLPSICQYDIPDCTADTLPTKDKMDSTTMILIIVASVVGVALLCLILCCIISHCQSACKKYRTKKIQRRSFKYYSRPPSTARQSTAEPRCYLQRANENGDNDANEKLIMGADAAARGDDDVLHVKGSMLPTAESIAAEVATRKGLLVDMNTGKATVKRINAPSPSRVDNASTRSLKSFKMEAGGTISRDMGSYSEFPGDDLSRLSTAASDDENSSMLANLDNMDKPSNNSSKIVFKSPDVI